MVVLILNTDNNKFSPNSIPQNMKRLLFAAFVLLLKISAYAQNTPNEQLQHIFKSLDQSVMTTGYLVNQQFSFIEPGLFQGNITDTARADINVFGMLFGAMHNSKTMNGGGGLCAKSILFG